MLLTVRATAQDTRIVIHLKHQPRHRILVHQFLLALFRILIHTAELVDLKDTPVLSHAVLRKEDRPRIGKEDDRSDKDH